MFGRKANKINFLEIDLAYYKRLSDKYWESYSQEIQNTKTRVEEVEVRLNSINKALAEENRDLVRQLELYKAVLAQLQIPIKLPTRKQ